MRAGDNLRHRNMSLGHRCAWRSPCRWTRSSGSASAAIPPSRCCWKRKNAATASPITRRTGWRCWARRWSRTCSRSRFATSKATISRAARRTELTEFDVVLLRQDPPFDLAYITTTHLLERIQPGTLVVNDPSAVRNAPEKMFVMEFPELMPPTLITRDLAEIKAFRAEHGDIVMKPLYGKGGEAVFRLAPQDLNFGSLFDLFSVTFREAWVVQKFLPAVRHGDKRIILVDGEFAGAVNRVPAPDDLRSNLVRGGAPKETDLTRREREICTRLGPP